MYGGAAGGGKTEALLMWLAEGINIPTYSGIFIRRSFTQLSRSNDSPIMRSARLYKPLGGKYNASDHRWIFPSGAMIEFGHMQHESSVMDYQGPSFHRVAFDELTQFSETQYTFLFSRLRKADGFPISLGIRATSNPGGQGHEWVKARFVTEEARLFTKRHSYKEPSTPGAIFWTNAERCFVPARVADNPSLDVDDYIKRMLGHLPLRLREQMVNGDWDAVEGSLIDPTWFLRFAVEGQSVAVLDPTTKKRRWVRDEREMRRFMTIDTAGTSRERAEIKRGKPASWTVCAVWDYDRSSDTLFLRHVWRDRVEWLDIKTNVARVATDWGVKRGAVENAHFGPSLAAELRGKVALELVGPVIEEMTESGRGAKLERAIAAGLFERLESGRLMLPEPGRAPGVEAWLPRYEGELTSWTGDPDETSDQIDVSSYGCDYVSNLAGKWGGIINGKA